MNDHVDVSKLSAYLDGAVPARERGALERHLAGCADCAARKAALEGAVRSLRGMPAVVVTPAESDAIRQAVLKGASTKAPAGVLRWRPRWNQRATFGGAAAALAAVAAVVIGFAVVRSGPNHSTSGSAARAVQAPQAAASFTTQPTPGQTTPAFANDAEVRAYAISLPGVANVLGISGGGSAPNASAAPLQETLGQTAPPTAAEAPAPYVNGAARPSQKAAQGDLGPAPTLGSCERTAVPSGAPPLYGTAVVYQGSPAWLIAYAVPPPSGATPGVTSNQVAVEIRSQSACALLDTATLVP